MPVFVIVLFGLIVGCGSAPAPAPQADRIPDNAWMTVGLEIEGPAAAPRKYRRCAEVATLLGIGISPDADVTVKLHLDGAGNKKQLISRQGAVLSTFEKPQVAMEVLCVDAFVTAAEVLKKAPVVGKGEPAGACVPKGNIETSVFMPTDESAMDVLKLESAKRGMNVVSGDLMITNQSGQFKYTAHGYHCQ